MPVHRGPSPLPLLGFATATFKVDRRRGPPARARVPPVPGCARGTGMRARLPVAGIETLGQRVAAKGRCLGCPRTGRCSS